MVKSSHNAHVGEIVGHDDEYLALRIFLLWVPPAGHASVQHHATIFMVENCVHDTLTHLKLRSDHLKRF